jgi:hypothetical protein
LTSGAIHVALMVVSLVLFVKLFVFHFYKFFSFCVWLGVSSWVKLFLFVILLNSLCLWPFFNSLCLWVWKKALIWFFSFFWLFC